MPPGTNVSGQQHNRDYDQQNELLVDALKDGQKHAIYCRILAGFTPGLALFGGVPVFLYSAGFLNWNLKLEIGHTLIKNNVELFLSIHRFYFEFDRLAHQFFQFGEGIGLLIQQSVHDNLRGGYQQ